MYTLLLVILINTVIGSNSFYLILYVVRIKRLLTFLLHVEKIEMIYGPSGSMKPEEDRVMLKNESSSGLAL